MLKVTGTNLSVGTRRFRCATGKGGFSADKREGDGATPLGIFPLRECWYRADRIDAPKTTLPLKIIHENDGWCDDPKSAEYNRHIVIEPSPSGRGQGEGFYSYTKPELVERARELRKDSPSPEQKMWSLLRNRQLNGLKFRRQHPIPLYVADFYCEEIKLIIELDGNQHGMEEGLLKNARRTAFWESLGYKVVRFTNHEMRENFEGVAETLFALTENMAALTLTLSQRERGLERLWRNDGVYDLIVPLGYNDDPVIPGKGSAIFLHVAKPDYSGTEGCVALALADLLSLLKLCHAGMKMEILPA